MRIAFVLNPAAQGGRARRMQATLDREAQALGLDYSISETLGPRDATRLALSLRDAVDLVVAVGGDGTVQEVAAGLAGSGTAFGVLPVGTGNDFATAIGMPRRLGDALRALTQTATTPVDLGRVRWRDADGAEGEQLFTNCLGAGIDAQAAAEAARYKLVQGRSAYLAGILRSLWLWRTPRAEIEVWAEHPDQGRPAPFYRGAVILFEIGNGPTLGGGFRITPDAQPHDGVLDVCAVRHVPTRRVLQLLPKAVTGNHQNEPEVQTTRATTITVEARSGSLPVQADGEMVSEAAVWLHVEVVPGALQVVAPGL